MEGNTLAAQHPLEHWIIEVDNECSVGPLMEEPWSKHSIYRIPEGFINPRHKDFHEPKVVSFGPYHHGKHHLKPLEDHKHRVLIRFLGRAKISARNCVDAVEGAVLQTLMDSYDQLGDEWRERGKFLQLMITDGCFMLEIFRSRDPNFSKEYADNDPIFSERGRIFNMTHIKRDMLMIENQLPLLLLKKLVAFEPGSPKDEEYINKRICEFFTSRTLDHEMGTCFHVLDVFRRSMLSPWPALLPRGMGSSIKIKQQRSAITIMQSASELHDSGIHFKRSLHKELDTIRFHRGTLKLPPMTIDDMTECTWLNLIAYEQLHNRVDTDVTSYVFFMASIINTAEDVRLFRSKGIINNTLESDEVAAKLFNSISTATTLNRKNRLQEVQLAVNRHCSKTWNRLMGRIRGYYAHHNWDILVFMTVLQTVYTVLPYHYKSHN